MVHFIVFANVFATLSKNSCDFLNSVLTLNKLVVKFLKEAYPLAPALLKVVYTC